MQVRVVVFLKQFFHLSKTGEQYTLIVCSMAWSDDMRNSSLIEAMQILV